MKLNEFDKLFIGDKPVLRKVQTIMHLFTPTYDNRTWQIVVTDEEKVSIRIVNEEDPDNIVKQELYLTKNSFAQLYFLLTSIVVEHVDIDEKYVTDWVASFDNIG